MTIITLNFCDLTCASLQLFFGLERITSLVGLCKCRNMHVHLHINAALCEFCIVSTWVQTQSWATFQGYVSRRKSSWSGFYTQHNPQAVLLLVPSHRPKFLLFIDVLPAHQIDFGDQYFGWPSKIFSGHFFIWDHELIFYSGNLFFLLCLQTSVAKLLKNGKRDNRLLVGCSCLGFYTMISWESAG